MLKTRDNSEGFTVNNSADLQNLQKYSGKPVQLIIKECPDLLVFPHSLNEHKDEIGRQIIFSLQGNKLATHNMMGYIGINETQLCIASRFDYNENDFFLHYMLQKVFSLNIFDLKLGINKINIWNFLLYLFPYFLNKALKQGLYKTYISFGYNDANVKGSIKIKRHITANTPFSGKIAYNTREHSFDNKVTQLIRHAIEYIKTDPLGIGVLSSQKETRENVKFIIENTPEYNRSRREKIISINSRPMRHPYYSGYFMLQKICLQILKNKKITFGANKEKIYGLLFDGAWLWEEYLNKVFLANNAGFDHPQNREKKGCDYLFSDGNGQQPIYPDFIKREKKGKTARYVGDAKYKHLDRRGNETGREDYYQLLAYMYRYECGRGYLFFPYSGSGKEPYRRERNIDGNQKDRKCIEIGLTIEQSEHIFKDFKKAMENSEKQMCKDLY